jgi:hypothetical protein
MKNTFTLFAFIFILTVGYAQNERHFCGYDHKVQEMIDANPDYALAYENNFNEAKRLGEISVNRSAVVTIPVVIHIVWHTNRPEENLPDSVIEDQIRVLNESYRFTNADKGNLRDTFNSIVGDAMIEFELAGVVRVETTSNFGFNNTDNAKKSATGGSDAWDTEQFLNIWVFKLPSLLGGQLLGQAYPPPGLAIWPFPANLGAPSPEVDGAIVDFRVFGSNNPNSFGGYDAQGRTTVHEVGHYLGLRHIWGDGNCGADDGVNDTPKANNSSTSFTNVCNPNRNSCGNEPAGFPNRPDMWENYMDYATESCQVALTNGQITIMRGVLEGPRAGLLSPIVTGLNLAQTKGFGVYPNPIYNGVARFYASEKPNYIAVYDIVGNQVYLNEQVSVGQELSFEGFQKGVYIIIANFNDGNATQKVILN